MKNLASNNFNKLNFLFQEIVTGEMKYLKFKVGFGSNIKIIKVQKIFNDLILINFENIKTDIKNKFLIYEVTVNIDKENKLANVVGYLDEDSIILDLELEKFLLNLLKDNSILIGTQYKIINL